MSSESTQFIITSDDVKIRYFTAGSPSNPTFLLIPGWSQTAAQWRKQISHFSSKYYVISYDHRGHGESDKPGRGMRMSRLSADLHELVTQLDLKDVVFVGHSMGCSVIWGYWDTFVKESRARVKKFVFVDQFPVMIANPTWDAEYSKAISSLFPPITLYELGAEIGAGGEKGAAAVRQLIGSMFTPDISEEDFEWVLKQNAKISGKDAETLLINHAAQDWRDVFPTINKPALVVAGAGGSFPSEGQQWIARHIPGAKCRVFTKEEKGSHFMFWENPELFNKVVEEFLES